MTEVSNLADTARATRVAVIGAGIGGLVAGYECAKLGMPVTVFEATERIGGLARTVDLDGARADVAASAFSTSPELDALIDELGLTGEVVSEAETQRMTTVGGRLVPLPPGVLGIPANPFLAEVVKVIGWSGAWRAYLDRLRPPLTIGHERNLAKLVGGRMGDRVLDRLVTPRTRGGFGMTPDEVDVDAAAPGLNAALTTQGSLSGAAASVLAEAPKRTLRSFRGGIGVLADTLAQRIRDLGGIVRTGVDVTDAVPTDRGLLVRGVLAESVSHGGSDADPAGAGEASEAHSAEDAPGSTMEETFDAVFIAADEGRGRALVAQAAGLVAAEPQGPMVDVASLLVRAGDESEWGAGVFTPADDDRVWSVSDESARWPERGRPAGTRVLRAVLPHAAGSADPDAAVAEVSRVLGGIGDVQAVRVDTMRITPPTSMHGFPERARGVRAAVSAVPGLGAVGAWVAGSGIASVAADAVGESERVRRALLFDEAAG